MSNVPNIYNMRGGRTGGRSGVGETLRIEREATSHKYESKMECYATLVERMDKYPSSRDSEFNSSVNYTGDYNSWLMSTGYLYTSTTTKNWAQNGLRESYYEQGKLVRWTTGEGFVEINAKGSNASLKLANNQACYEIFKKIRTSIPRVQMDNILITTESNQELEYYSDEITEKWNWIDFGKKQWRYGYHKELPRVQNDIVTEQGVLNQSSDKQSNTIITQDQAESKSLHVNALDSAVNIASSEPLHKFHTITNRWMPLDSFKISTADKQGALIKSYYLPETLYKDGCSPNLIPFETFIYGRMDMEIRIVVNANKFCCGKLLMSSKYDSYQADLVQASYQSALARNHVIIDLCANNEGVIQIPFRYHRPYVRLVKNDTASVGVRPSKYASIYLHMLSALQTGTGGPSEIGVRLFFRLKSAAFTGMSYRVKVQMDTLSDLAINTAGKALRATLVEAERVFDQVGRSQNQDKPSKIQAITVVPQPRLNFTGGVGVADIVPLRMNPHTLTNYKDITYPSDEPKSFYDLARIWGVVKSFEWASTSKEGDVILEMFIDPTSRSYTEDKDGEMTPLEYACGNYAFWTGPIEIRLDFVSNAFHTGTVQLSAEFGRESAKEDTCQSSSAYTKIFHLGEQKSVNFTIPYIYDTIMRRSTANYVNPYNHIKPSDQIGKQAITLAPLSKTKFKVRVMNLLRPVVSASQKIECLVFMRAGKNFHMHGLKGFSYIPIRNMVLMDEFPYDYQIVEPAAEGARRKRETNKPDIFDHKTLPDSVRNEWNEYKAEALPKFQMDNGEKETMDETEDFSEGVSARVSLTSENQLSFKDLLRRPTLIMNRVKVPANTGNNAGFFIPLQPPSRQMAMLYDETKKEYSKNGDWSTTIGSSAAASIMDMFRCWRGSMRYTIVTYSVSNPFYVSTVPHSGVRLLSNHGLLDNADLSFNMAGFNFNTAIVVPSINPTITVEAPYETENTWTLTFDEDALRSYSWRDKGDYNAGHLLISTHVDFVMDVWWSAGDDFEIANFYGTPFTRYNGRSYRLTDAHARVQMDTDFQIKEGATKVSSFLKKYVQPGMLARAAVGAIPYVGTPILVAETLTNVHDKINTVSERVDSVALESLNTINKINELADTTQVSISSISALISDTVNSIGNTLTGLVHGVDLLYNLLLDIIIAWMEQSWKVIGIAIVRFIGKFASQSFGIMDKLMDYAAQISDYIQNLVVNNTPVVQVDADNTYTYVGILAGLVGTILGVRLNPMDWHGSWTRNIGLRLTSATGIAYLVHVMNFVKQTFATMREMFMRALGYVSPEAEALKLLSESSVVLDKFVRESQIMTSESNMALINQPVFRRRFWHTVLQAHQIQRMLCAIPANVVSYQLSKLCNDVIKMGNEKFLDLSASPVRFEPMVICLEGEPGVGKSYVTESLVDELLIAIGHNTRATEKIFYRTAGERFWSGYRDQPVVVYDEWLNTTDPSRNTDQIAEFMKLKSTAIFVPEMAHLEEKKIRGNPLIIILCCNSAFPNALADYATYPKAILRRRDVVLNVTRQMDYEGVDPINCTEEQKKGFRNYDHLAFNVYKNVTDSASKTKDSKKYEDTKKWLVNSWKKYFIHQKEQVKIRMERLPNYMNNVPGNFALADPFTIFYQLNAQIDLDQSVNTNGFTHYEALETAIALTIGAINQPMVEPNIEVEDIPWDTAVTQSDISIGGIATSIAWFGMVPSWISSVCQQQLLKWEEQILPVRTELHTCLTCLEDDVACAYVCIATKDTDVKHCICATCYASLMQFGNGKCPMCRCDSMELLLGREDVNNLSVWYRLVHAGLKTTQWLCEKIISYYNWRTTRRGLALLTDMILTQGMFRINPTIAVSINVGLMAQYYGRAGYTLYRMWNVFEELISVVQSDEDDWMDYEIPSTQVTPSTSNDVFEITINDSVIDNYILRTTPTPICLHRKLKQHLITAKFEGGVWRVMDDVERRVLDISPYACERDCYLLDQEDPVTFYRQMIEQWLNANKRGIRIMYIDYYNTPTISTLERIPEVFRAAWMFNDVPVISTSWWVYLSEKWTMYKNFFIYSAAAISVVAALLGAYNLATRVSTISGAMQQVSATAGSPERQPRNPRRLLQRDGGRRAYFHAETGTPSLYEVATGYICRNTFAIEIKVGTKSKMLYGTGLFNHFLLIPRHYIREIKKAVLAGHRIYGWPLSQPQLKAEIILTSCTMKESDETDLAYIILPPKFPIFKDIRKFLSLDSDYDTPITSEGILLANPKSGCEFMREVEVDIAGIQSEQVILDNDGTTFTVRDVLVYNYSKPGVCGSLLVRENHQRPILSMHIAGIGEGVSGKGYGILLTQDALRDLCENTVVPTQFDDVLYDTVEQAKFVFDEDIHLYYYGSVPPEKTPYIPAKSKLVKSLIHGAPGLETNMEPAILDKKDSRYIHQETPLSAGIKKHGVITRDFTVEQINTAKEGLWDNWLSKMKPLVADPKVLTDSQSVIGLDINHYTGMDLTTSAGYPYTLNKQKTLKSDYIKVKRDSALKPIDVESWDDMLITIMTEKREKRKQGIVPHTHFTDTLKDEKRPLEKVLKLGGTRVFCNSPVDYVIECRKYFLHFIAAFMDQRMDLMHAVGINPTSVEWTWLTNNLLAKNGDFCTIDYSNFGPGYNSGVAQAAYELIIRWVLEHVHTEEGDTIDERYLRCVVYECLQSIHICNNTVYQQGAGSPSGAVFTTVVNTLVNQLYLIIAWHALVPQSGLQLPINTFKNNVSLFCFGDDGIFTVSPEYLEMYNMTTIMDYFNNYGIVATDAQKSGERKIVEKLSDAQFLKRGFKLHPTKLNTWLPPLKFESIRSCTQWIWKSENMKEATRVNANAALMEAYTHGPIIFEQFKGELNRALRKAKIPSVTGQWEDFDNMFMTTGFEFNIDAYLVQN